MNDALRIDLERYLAGGMSADEKQGFLDVVRRDPDALALLGRSLEDQAYLYDALHVGAEAGSRPHRDTARVFRAARLGSRPGPTGGPAAGWIIGAIAAGAAALLVLYSSSTPKAKPAAPKQPMAKVVEIPPPPREEPKAPTPQPLPVPAPVAKVETPLLPPPAPAPVAESKPADAPRPPDPKPVPAPTVVQPLEKVLVAIGRIEQGATVTPLTSGMAVDGPALLRFTDGTRLDLASHTVVQEIVEDGAGKRVTLTSGALAGDIAKQPFGRPMVFVTPHAVAKVVGTALKLTVDARSTRLDVREGKVNLKRSSDSRAVDVSAGAFAVAGDGDLAAKPLPIDEILLSPAHGEGGGTEWHVVRDPAALGGVAFEALRTSNRQPFTQTADASRVTFTFKADANRDYSVWVRGHAPSKVDPIKHDAVILEFLDSKVAEREGGNKGAAGGGERALFNGYMHNPGYWWVGGDADGNNDETPVVVRFNHGGAQTVRLYASEVPIRIDAIWISATQKTRPDAQGGPAAERK